MKKRFFAVLCVATMLFTGCGAVELTDSESDLIAEYAASMLLKYSNTYQPKLQEEVFEVETTQAVPTLPVSTDLSGTQGEQSSLDNSSSSKVEESSKSLSEALGIAAEGFEVEYTGYEMTQNYPNDKDAYFSMRSTEKNRLLVMKFTITNHSGEEKECDLLSKERTYRCQINDTERFGAQLTMLLDDLASFKEVFSDGESKTAVLIFQVPLEYEEEGTITGLSLSVKGDGETNRYQVE